MCNRAAKLVVVALLGVVLSCIATVQGNAGVDSQNFTLVEKGHYLATAADCFACHTTQNGGKPFAGGRAIETPFGNITTPNITPDSETGIGAWTDDQFVRAVRDGIRPDGGRLYPAMPFTAYTKMSRNDVLAIRAYLKTVEPVRHPVKANTLPFPFDIRAAMRVWDALYFTAGEFKPDPGHSSIWNRGAYLVQGPGHCGACHTPKTFLGGDKTDESLRGAKLQGWSAPDITGDQNEGLGRWSEADIADYLKAGHNHVTAATGPMAEVIADSTSQMSDDDRKAIATYLKSLAGMSNEAVPEQAKHAVMVAGQAIYRSQCSACHGLEGKGTEKLFPSLADSSLVRASDPSSAIRLVLRGGRSVATASEPTAPGMPSFAWQLSDAQVAAVLTYVRNSWKTAAAPVSTADVTHARKALRTRTE